MKYTTLIKVLGCKKAGHIAIKRSKTYYTSGYWMHEYKSPYAGLDVTDEMIATAKQDAIQMIGKYRKQIKTCGKKDAVLLGGRITELSEALGVSDKET